jgi:hypothetical protein
MWGRGAQDAPAGRLGGPRSLPAAQNGAKVQGLGFRGLSRRRRANFGQLSQALLAAVEEDARLPASPGLLAIHAVAAVSAAAVAVAAAYALDLV